MKKSSPFATEVDLCAAFIEALPKGWTNYNECCGWDILLVRDADGFQIGIQAKLKFNLAVLHQAIETDFGKWSTSAGPDCRAVMIPDGAGGIGSLADYLGLTVIEVCGKDRQRWRGVFEPELPVPGREPWRNPWFDLAPAKRHELPDYVPDCRAGDKAPLQLTEWKIKALKIAALLELRGFVTREDFKHINIDHRRWFAGEWLVLNGARQWVRGKHCPTFAEQHPRNYAEILADAEKWLPKVMT